MKNLEIYQATVPDGKSGIMESETPGLCEGYLFFQQGIEIDDEMTTAGPLFCCLALLRQARATRSIDHKYSASDTAISYF